MGSIAWHPVRPIRRGMHDYQLLTTSCLRPQREVLYRATHLTRNTHKNMHHPAITNITMAELMQLGCTVRTLKGYNFSEVEVDLYMMYEDDLTEDLEEILEDPSYWDAIERSSWERY